MPDLKVLIGGKNYQVSCNPGEEGAVNESASLLDQEAELIQTQLGRLSEEKMLLLSGLLLGDKIRALKHEKTALEENLRATQSKLNALNSKVDNSLVKREPESHNEKFKSLNSNSETSKLLSLQSISDLLDTIIQDFEPPFKDKRDDEVVSKTDGGGQATLL
tara:strand:+ start:2050 stop:2535 length:486 start_codon:yes stop_codon:yes gene_type:complete